MVVSCIAHISQVADLYRRLDGVRCSSIYEETISNDETLLAIRADNPLQARQIGGMLYRAGALEVDIDEEAA